MGSKQPEIPPHKYRCAKCKYHTYLGGAKSSGRLRINYVICYYIVITGSRRPCPASCCSVFEAGKPVTTEEDEKKNNTHYLFAKV